jgi:hypothetical protein
MAISKQCAEGGKLVEACDGRRIDLERPAALEYLRGKGVAPPKVRKSVLSRAPAPTAPPSVEADEALVPEVPPAARPGPMAPADARAYLLELTQGIKVRDLPSMTLQQVVERFGTFTQFTDLLDARKKIADIVEKDLKNDATTGRLIERELVKTHVFGAMEQQNKRLLQDAAPNITRTIYAAARSGKSVEEAENEAREILTRILSPAKESAARALRGGRGR